MTLHAFLLILLSIFLHVGWNFISKKNTPSAAFYLLNSMTSCTIYMPCVIFSGIDWAALGWHFWLFYLCSVFSEVIYFVGLFKTYRHTDISLAYPMVRALPVLLVAAVTGIFGIGKPLNFTAVLGMVIVFCGCVIMPLNKLSDFSWRNYVTPMLGFILLAACGTTGYTIFDGMLIPKLLQASASKALLTTCAFISMIEGGIVVGLSLYVLAHKEERKEFKRLAGHTAAPHFCGLCSSSAYVLVVMAMPLVTNVSFVQAFRQMSLPLGVAAGVFLLKEKCPPIRLAGVAAVVAGLVITALR